MTAVRLIGYGVLALAALALAMSIHSALVRAGDAIKQVVPVTAAADEKPRECLVLVKAADNSPDYVLGPC